MLSKSLRLETIASLVPDGARVCDIGTDHGYLAILLEKSGKVKKVIATDVNSKPLENARKNIQKEKLSNIELRLCDGLDGILESEVNTVVIAGMGGEVISGILEKGYLISKDENITFILQPTTSPEILREFLNKNGYEILKEIPIFENNKLYSVMKVSFTGKQNKIADFLFYIGKITPLDKAGFLYIKKQQERCFKCMNSLKNIDSKKDDYLKYKNLYERITEYLNTFTEKYNGI